MGIESNATWGRLVVLPLFLLVSIFSFLPLNAATATSPSEHEYRIGPNDVIRVQVFGEDDLTVERKVGGDGNITFPLLGDVQVGGRTIKTLQEELSAKLAEGYVRQPKVSAYIVRYRNFYVSGEVKTPGAYTYEEGLTVQKAISLAGGFTEKSDRHVIKVVRGSHEEAEAYAIPQDALVSPDDTISVAQIRKFYVTGEVGRAGGYNYEDGLTVQKAVSLAGGATEKADRDDIKLTRVASGVAETLKAKADMPVLADDIITVEPQTHKFYASGEVKTPGSFPYKEGLTVHKAIALAGGLTEKAERGEFHVLRQVQGQEETLPVKWDSVMQPDDILVVAEGQRFYVSGEVKTPGRYLYEKGLTVHKAVSMAGGATEKAEKNDIKLTRVASGVAETLRGEPDLVVLPDDIITVEPQTHKFYASGEVKTPGSFPYKEGLTVHKAIALAGGLTEKAERGEFHVLRQVQGQEETLPVKWDSVMQPDDILVVAEGQRFYVSGEVKTPGRYLYEKGLTVHKAVSMAGGATEKAEKSDIKLTRVASGVAETLRGEPDLVVLPDDIITVEPQTHKFYASGEVKTPGSFPYKEGLTVHKAIALAGGLTEKAERGEFHVLRQVQGREETLPVKWDSVMQPDDILVVAEGQRFYVSGEVKTPGRYLYEKGLTVHKAVSMAGGMTEKAEKRDIKVRRVTGNHVEVRPVELDGSVSPDDFIVVERVQRIYVDGEVKKPGDYSYEKGITVHKVITMAGGFTDKASEGRTKVLRMVNGEEQSLGVKLDDPILPEDIVVVPKRFF